MAVRFWALIVVALGSWSAQAQSFTSAPLDTLLPVVIEDVVLAGNQITRDRVLFRETTVASGDTLPWILLNEQLEQTRRNLMNTGLFNFVEPEVIPLGGQTVLITLEVQERWYTFPSPIFEIAETNFNTWWERRDFSRTNYGLYLVRQNFRGLNETLTLTARFGYTRRFSIAYRTPNLNRAQTLGLDFSAGYFENRELVYSTRDNERLFYNNDNGLAREFGETKAGLRFRPNIFTLHRFEVKYHWAQVRDTVFTELNPEYFPNQAGFTRYATLAYNVSHDKRDYKPYPLRGYEVSFTAEQNGLGFEGRNEPSIFTTLGHWRHHVPLSKKFYAAYSARFKYTWSNNVPYYLISGLGYNDYVRGYEFYVIDGTRYTVLKSGIKYELLAPRNIKLPLVPTEKFSKTFLAIYANVFADAGYVTGSRFASGNSLANNWLTGIGFGLDIVTYYDVVVRTEYTFNGLGEGGFFVHFIQPF